MRLVLASESPQKKSLLNKLGLSFSIVPPEINEKPKKGEKSEAHVRRIALKKAMVVSKDDVGAHVVAHDMVIDFNGKIVGKPKDKAEAKVTLESLSGTSHTVIGAIVIVKGSEPLYQGVSQTKVTFKKLSKDDIEQYLNGEEWEGKAGSYAIQGDGGMFIESIDGSYFNIVGLPLLPLIKALEKFGNGMSVSDEVKSTVEMQEKSIKESFPR